MKKYIYAIIFVFALSGIWGMNSVDTSAATKEYNLDYTLDSEYAEIYLDDQFDWVYDMDMTKIANVTNSDDSLAQLEIEPEDGIFYIYTEETGSCDISFDYEGDTYVIHFTVKARQLKTQSIKVCLTKKNAVVDLTDNFNLLLNDTEVESVAYEPTGIVALSKNYEKITLKKAGKTVITYRGTDEDVAPVEGKLNVEVITLSAAKKDALEKAKTLVAKKSKKAKFAYVDLNFDGIKDLVINGRSYLYSTSSMKFVKGKEYSGTIYISNSKKHVMEVYKNTKKSSQYYGTTFYNIYNKDGNTVAEYAKLSSKTKKNEKISKDYASYGVDWDGGAIYMSGISKSKFNSAIKKYMPGKKAVKTYTNTAKNRKKIVK